jgi:hypothetical protein
MTQDGRIDNDGGVSGDLDQTYSGTSGECEDWDGDDWTVNVSLGDSSARPPLDLIKHSL